MNEVEGVHVKDSSANTAEVVLKVEGKKTTAQVINSVVLSSRLWIPICYISLFMLGKHCFIFRWIYVETWAWQRKFLFSVLCFSSSSHIHCLKFDYNFNITFSSQLISGNSWGSRPPPFVFTPYHHEALADLLQSHSVADMCIIGPRGCGKSAVVAKMAHMLGYQTEPILLYQVNISLGYIKYMSVFLSSCIPFWKI